MKIGIVTINYNSSAETRSLLQSLESQSDTDFSVCVVDNASAVSDQKHLGDYILNSSLRIEVTYSQRNTGYSGGNNIGISSLLREGADWIVLLNNDTTVDADFIACLRTALPNESAILGLPLDEGDRVVSMGIVEWLRPTLKHLPTRALGRLAYAIGAALVIHRDVIASIGLLDESYFLYFEDADFSMRARDRGVPVLFPDGPLVHHGVSKSTRKLGSPALLRYHYRNMIRFTRQHAPAWARISLPVWMVATALRQLLKIALRISPARSLAILRGIFDGMCGRSGSIARRPRIAIECESLKEPPGRCTPNSRISECVYTYS